jgi:hypothetical protein
MAQIVLEFLDGTATGGELRLGKDRLERTENSQRPISKRLALVARHAQHVADQLDRQRGCEVGDEIDPPARLGAIEQAIDQRLDARLKRFERARREERCQQPADPRVVGRVVEHQAGGVMFV